MRTTFLLLMLSTAALAADPARIDFTQAVIDDGIPVIDDAVCPPDKATGDRKCEIPLTIGEVAYRALRFPDRDVTWEEGLKRDELGRAIRKAKDWPLTDDQRKMLEKTVPKLYPTPALIGIISRALGEKK